MPILILKLFLFILNIFFKHFKKINLKSSLYQLNDQYIQYFLIIFNHNLSIISKF